MTARAARIAAPGRARLAGISSFLAHPVQWHRRPCTRRVYAARVALEVIVLLAVIAGLASVPWFRHEPALVRFAIGAIPCGISAASAATVRRLGPPAREPRDDRGQRVAVTAAAQLQARPPPSRNPRRPLTGTLPGPGAGDSRRRMRQAIVLDITTPRRARAS